VGFVPATVILGSRDESELMAKLVWRVKLVAELQAGETTEVEVALVHGSDVWRRGWVG
jgi:cellobiose-specific phosphotransferase system component IIA